MNNFLLAVLDTTIVAEGGTLELPPNQVALWVNTTRALFYATASPSDGVLLPMDLNTTVVCLHSLARYVCRPLSHNK